MKKRYRGKNDNIIRYGEYSPNEEEIKAKVWCIRNKIIVFPETKLAHEWSVEININGKKYKSPNKYRRDIVWKKMYEFYEYYYKKYSNENNV